MLRLAGACAVVIGLCPGHGVASAAEPLPDDPAALFQQTLAATRMPVALRDGHLSGPGAAFLEARANESQFVLVGEEHGVADIASTVRALLAGIGPLGYRHLAIEVDPWTTAKLETMLRQGGTAALAAYLARDDAKLSLPFYNWSTEAALAQAAVRANGEAPPALWGLDQLFIGAAGTLLADIAAGAANAQARALAQALAARAKGSLEFLGTVELRELQELHALLGDEQDREWAQLAAGMIESARIYQPFVAGRGLSVHAANLERETLMKRTFLARMHEAQTREGRMPKVLFKFGANHMMRGLSPTYVPSLGNFVSEFALAQGKSAFGLLILCGPGTKAADFMGNEADCEFDAAKAFPDLVAHVDPKTPTLFDLRRWKDRPKQWAHLAPEVRAMIWAYDALLFVPGGKPAQPLRP